MNQKMSLTINAAHAIISYREKGKEMSEAKKSRKHIKGVENLQLLGLGLTVIGQVFVRFDLALAAQLLWLVANIIALGRDFYLERCFADKAKNGVLTALTLALVISMLVCG